MESEGTVPPTILVANDQEWTLRTLETVLSAEGYRVVRAYTGRQALEAAVAHSPDLAILDLQLPDVSGVEVCRELRRRPESGPGMPVIVTTAAANPRRRQAEVFAAGAWDFFGQPLDGDLLLAKVRTFLAARAEWKRLSALSRSAVRA